MTTYNLAINKNPNFDTVNSLTNLTFDRNNVRSGRMATEAQIQQLWQDIILLEQRIDYCCRDIVFWDFRVRIRDKQGNIISEYLDNRTTGISRRGKPYTMTLPIKAVPKYELQSTVGQIDQSYYVDGDRTSCWRPDITQGNFVAGLCQLLYRGNSGQYYDMSARKNTVHQIGQRHTNSFFVKTVNVNGQEQSSINFLAGSIVARADDDGNITINSNQPIDSVTGSGSDHGAYGHIWYLDLRDVTLEA